MTGQPREQAPATSSAAVCVAVGLASADASVVALALPDLYRELHVSIVEVSWVLTSYAVAAALAGVVVATLVPRRVTPLPPLALGLVVFAVASAACGLVSTLPALVVGRCAQGVGAAVLLAAALPALELRGGTEAARRWWTGAGAIGVAAGPAVGGALTQLFHWRAIFLVQAPVVVAIAAVLLAGGLRAATPAPLRGPIDDLPPPPRARAFHPSAAMSVLVLFAALVGALFLGVLLLVVVWGHPPLEGAVIVSALPGGMVAARLLGGGHGAPVVRAVGGAVLLCGGLAGLALLPGSEPWLAAAALCACGAGFDLVGEVVGPASLPVGAPGLRSASWSTAARHAGLVVGLVVVAPILSTGVDTGRDQALLGGVDAMLDARLNTRDKVEVAWALRDELDATPRGEVPDVGAVFAAQGGDRDSLDRASAAVDEAVVDALTRSFRPAFAASAALAGALLVPVLVLVRPRRRGHDLDGAAEAAGAGRRAGAQAGGVVVVGCVGLLLLLGGELSAGAATTGSYRAEDPCTADPSPYQGTGFDAEVQRIALGAINGAACELGTSREVLVLSLDESRPSDVRWDHATIEDAMKAGADRAIADADDRGDIPGWVARILREVAARAPIGWLLDNVELPSIL